MKDSFQKLYKIYPLIPRFVRRWIVRNQHYRRFHLLPKPLIIFAQFIIGVVKKDLRFYTYLNYYFGHLMKKISCR